MDPGFVIEGLGHAAAALPAAAGAYLVAALLTLAAYAPGRSLAGDLPGVSSLERWAIATGLGLAALGTLCFALGLAGWFTRPAVGAGLCLLQLPRLVAWARAGRRGLPARWRRPSGAAVGAAAVALCLTLLAGTLALYPPLGFDATLYHLPAAAAMAETGELPYLPDSRVPVFPQLAEALFAAALLFGDDRAARLVELATAALTAVALFGWVRRRAGTGGAGLWAAALWAGSPYVLLFGADAYVDVTLTLFAALALVAADGWRETGAPRWAWLAGAFAGAAAATKYLGLFFLAVVPAGLLLAARSRRGVRAAGFALVAAAVVAGPWYGRIAHLTGNPVFPFFPRIFGTNEWQPMVGLVPGPTGAAGGVASMSSAVRALAVGAGGEWSTWSGPPPFDPFLWVLAPAALLLARRPRPPLLPVLLGLSYAPVVWLLAPEPRYLLPALPWACAAVALGAHRLWPGERLGSGWRHRAAAGVAALLLVAPGAVYAAYRVARQGPVPRTEGEREQFLAARRPGYRAIRALEARAGSDYTLYNLGGEDLRYFARGRYLGDWSGPARFSVVTEAAARGPGALAATLRSLDADFLLVVTRTERAAVFPGAAEPPPGFPLLYGDAGSRLYAVPEPSEVSTTTP